MRTKNYQRTGVLWSALRSAAVAGFVMATASMAAAQDAAVHLIAAPTTQQITLPNGTSMGVPMWGYALDLDNDGAVSGAEQVTVPGPRIAVPVGGNLTITLTNLLPEATSIIIPGQPFAATPARNADNRARSMTEETQPAGTKTYSFAGLKPGTFLYQSGSHVQVQVQMGLYGAMTKDESAGVAYAGTAAYASEAVVLFSEIDEALHAAVNDGTYGTSNGPTSAVNYRPSIFLINGQSYSGASAASIPAGAAGQVTLLRILNAGLRQHAPVIDNGQLTIIAEDGNKLPFAKDQATVMLAAGKTHDALWTPAAEGGYALYDRILGLNAPGQAGAGMLAKLAVAAAGAPDAGAPIAVNDLINGVEDTPTAGAVLGNDTNAVSAVLVASTHGGALAFNPNGTFTYTPSPDFFGIDEFSYRAVNATSQQSAPALVTIVVAGVADPPIASALTVGVDQASNVSISLSGTDADNDPLKYFLKTLPAHGAVSYIDAITKIETPLSADNLRGGASEKAIPGGVVLYKPAAVYVGADAFNFVANDGATDSAQAAANENVYASPDAVDDSSWTPINLTVRNSLGAVIDKYRWTLEEDVTYKVIPGVADPNTLAVSLHKSAMPLVSSGDDSKAPRVPDMSKRYYISVLPTENNNSMSGAEIDGSTDVTVTVSPLPLPTARIRVRVFQDNAPLNGMWDSTEPGLAGFQVTLDDAGGTYGMSGGHMSTDTFGNKLGTKYQECSNPDGCDSYEVASLGDGFVLTDTDGYAVIENLAMGKYTVKVRAPGGDKWIQTTTIEGQVGIDAWVKPNEPQFFTEFGPPGPHVFMGFTRAIDSSGPLNDLAGPYTKITGRVTNLRQSRPPASAQFSGAPFNHTRPWVALNSSATGGDLLWVQPTNEDGTFAIDHVPAGSYSLVVFDTFDDLIIGTSVVNIAPDPITNILAPVTPLPADVAVFNWFTTLYSFVFDDLNGDGIHQADEPGMPDQALNIRFRDGSIYQSLSTDDRGFKAFNEVFPFFAWMIAEVDYTRFHSTGLTVVVDDGGDASTGPDWRTMPGVALPADVQADLPKLAINPQPQPDNGGLPFRTESGAGTPFLLLEGFQSFIGQSTLMMWGKAPYATPGSKGQDVNYAPFDTFDPGVPSIVPCPGGASASCPDGFFHDVNADGNVDADGAAIFDADHYNGGIAGIVHYTITRAENDPRWATAENWEAGVPDVNIQLWDATRAHLLNEGPTDNFNREGLEPTGCQWPGNSPYVYLGRTTDCFDGLRNFNQARPAAFDGGYAFSSVLQKASAAAGHEYDTTSDRECVADDYLAPALDHPDRGNCRDKMIPIPADQYVVKMVVPPGYKVQKEEDKNVDFGDTYVPQQFWLAGYPLADGGISALTTLAAPVTASATTISVATGGGVSVHPNDQITIDEETMRVTAIVGDVITVLRGQGERIAAPHATGTDVIDFGAQLAATVSDSALIAPFCVGELHQVPDTFSLFPGDPAPYGGEMKPLCDAKLVNLHDGQQVAPDFHLFTDAPRAGHIYGMVLDDTTNEADPNSPTFGEKYAPPFISISIKDWQGREITRTYTDQYGMYNALVPGTYTINPPMPSGVSPSILAACINSPTMTLPGGQVVPDPNFQKQYSHFCYPLQYLPGKTTYLDTPVLPTGAFTGNGTFPVDAEFRSGTPVIASVAGPVASAPGPYLVKGADDATRTIVIKSAADLTADGLTEVANPLFDGSTCTTTGCAAPKLIKRDYGFGDAQGTVTLGGRPLTITSWTKKSITAVVPLADAFTGEVQVARADGAKSTLGVTLSVATADMHAAKPPKVVASGGNIQAAIDAATPGDLILVQPGIYEEMVIMTKPVRLQGAGALTTTINVVTTPSERVQDWLDRVGNLLLSTTDYSLPNQPAMTAAPFQSGDVAAVVGDEGPGVMVLSKSQARYQGSEPDICFAVGGGETGGNVWTNFVTPRNEAYCLHNENYTTTGSNLSAVWRPNARIDGFSIIGSSNAPGVLVNAYARHLDIANNNISTNSGTYAGGVQLGHPGAPVPFGSDNANNDWVTIHHNHISQNAGVEVGGGGGIVLGAGSTGYKVTDNFIAGNFTGGNGAGISHIGLSNAGVIDHNTIVFNESFLQATSTNGGGIFLGATPVAVGAVTLGSGTVDVTNNLIQGNGATGGDGGGLAIQGLLGNDRVHLFNNMIANNVAGLAGGGIAIADLGAANGSSNNPSVDIVHNTIVHNDSTGTAGAAFTAGPLESVAQPAGIAFRGNIATQNVRIANSIVWQNRSFRFGAQPALPFCGDTIPPNTPPCSILPVGSNPPPTTYGEIANPNGPYWDLGVLGGFGQFAVESSVLTALTGATEGGGNYSGGNSSKINKTTAPPFTATYFNTDRRHAYNGTETTTLISVPAALDEGGNFVRPQFGPLSLTGVGGDGNALFSDLHTTGGLVGETLRSGANNTSVYGGGNVPAALLTDVDGDARPILLPDIGADQNSAPQLPPTLTSLSPNTGLRNTQATVTLTGTYLLGATAVNIAGSGVNTVSFTVVNGTTINATFNLAGAGALGAHNVSVTTPLGTSGNVVFTVVSPTLTSISPTSGARGSTVAMTFTGTGLAGAASVSLGNDIVCTLGTVSDTAVNASCVIGNLAGLSTRTASVTTATQGTVSLANAFTVTGPALTSISPTTGLRGATVPVTFTGTGLGGATAVTLGNSDITCTLGTVTSTTVTASCAISSTAGVNPRTATVVTPQGNATLANAFTVIVPTLTAVTPNSSTLAQRGTNVSVTLSGTNLAGATSVNIAGAGVSIVAGSMVVVDANTITVSIAVTSNTNGLGTHNVTVITAANGTTNAVTFTKN